MNRVGCGQAEQQTDDRELGRRDGQAEENGTINADIGFGYPGASEAADARGLLLGYDNRAMASACMHQARGFGHGGTDGLEVVNYRARPKRGKQGEVKRHREE